MSALDPRSGARLWLRVFMPFVAAAALLNLWTVLTPPFRGDLTRLGRLSETEFGPTLPESTVPPELLRSSGLSEAEVLVIGDSFSKALLWQSTFVARGTQVATTTWQELGPACADLPDRLRALGFTGHRVIFESIERELDRHLSESLGCERSRDVPIRTDHGPPIWNSAGPWGLNTKETLFSGMLTAMHTLRARESADPELSNRFGGADQVRIQTVDDGCRVFSHRLCHRGLFIADDRSAAPFSPASVVRMKELNARYPGLSITWIVIPNKSTIYLEPQRAHSAGALLVAEHLGPDLFALMAAKRLEHRDLYKPNDTHTSTDGYLLIGNAMLQWMQTDAQP